MFTDWRLCCLPLALFAAFTPATQAQGIPTLTDAHIRVLDPDLAPLPADFLILRGSDGRVIVPSAVEDTEIVLRGVGRKVSFEFSARGFKQHSIDLVLENAPRVYVTMCVDPANGHVKFLTQKPVFPDLSNKVTKLGGMPGTQNLVPPSNNACASASAILDGATAFNTAEATTDGPTLAAPCSSQVNNDIWYDYIATGTGTLTVSTCNAATFDTKLAIYNGVSCPALAVNQIGCNDDAGGCASFTSIATAPVIAGNHYLIRVGAFGATSTGSGTLTLTPPPPPPANDECAGAIDRPCNSSTSFSNLGASTNVTDPNFSCRFGGAGQGVGTMWFKFTPPGTSATIDTNGSAVSDTMLAIYSGTCGSLVELACDDDSGVGLLSQLTYNFLTPATTYYIQVASFSASSLGTISLNVSCLAGPPPGDLCESPLTVSCGGSTTFDNPTYSTSASDPLYSCAFFGPQQGVGTGWLTFVATATSAMVDTNLSAGATDTLLAVYDGTCGAFTELACSDDDGLGLLSQVCVTGLTPGNTYYIQASAFDAFSTGSITVSVECPCPAPPSNDDCDGAIALAVPSSTVFDNSLATDDIGIPCGLFSGPFKNVWYLVSGTGTTMTATTCNAGTVVDDTKIAVYCADCLQLVCVGGNDDDCGSFQVFSSTVNWCSQLGANYLVTVGTFTGDTTPGVIQLDLSENGSPCDVTVSCLPQGSCCLADGSCQVLTFENCVAAGGTYGGDGSVCVANAVNDGGFEAGPFGGTWTESSTNFGTPLCDSFCGFGGGTGPHSGFIWAWFGGVPAFEEGAVSQAVLIPASASTIDFYLEIPVSSGNGVDFLELTIDGTQIFEVKESDGTGPGYLLVQVPLGGFADGGVHTVEFHSIQTGAGGAISNFFVDDVSIATDVANCTPPNGACCLADGSCAQVSAEDCESLGGTYNGDGSSCGSVSCPQPNDCFTLNFDTDDSGNPMAHGTKVDVEFDGGAVFPVTITGTTNPSGGNTCAILNSSTGPAAQDPDLLVGSGNILILQTDAALNQCPPGSGVYCSHNDDEDGGRIDFVFNVPTTPSSIDLIDVDATDSNWRVVMVDVGGNQRIFGVPANWTGDLVTDGPPGMGTLDLTTLANQPGFGSTVTANEDAGFDGTAVVRVFVIIEGSGGIDNLNWCQPN